MKSVIAFVAHWMVLFCFVKCDISKIIKDHHEHITQTVERPTMALKERRGTKERRGKKSDANKSGNFNRHAVLIIHHLLRTMDAKRREKETQRTPNCHQREMLSNASEI